MAVTEKRALIGSSRPAQGGRGAPDRPGAVRRQPHASRAWSGPTSSAARTRTRACAASTSPPRSPPRAWSRPSPAPTSKDEWGGPLPMAWPVTEDTKNPPHWPLTPDVARYAGDGVAVVVAQTRALAKDAAELVEVDYEPLPAVTDVDGRARGRRAGRPRGARLESLFHLAAPGRRARPALLRGGGDGEGALPPAAADPERDRAARRPRPAHPGAGRVHDVVGDADPAHPPRHARRRVRDPGGEAARDRPGRRRRLRLEARRLRRGGASASFSRRSSACRSSGSRSGRRATSRRSTGATSSRRSSSLRPPRAR